MTALVLANFPLGVTHLAGLLENPPEVPGAAFKIMAERCSVGRTLSS